MIRRVKLETKRTPQVRAYEDALKRAQKSRHVIPRDGGWVVKAPDSKRSSSRFEKQADAVAAAKKTTERTRGHVFVHAKNGRIRERL